MHLLKNLKKILKRSKTPYWKLIRDVFLVNLQNFQRAIDSLVFYLASIDMRQDSSVHEACVAELLKFAGINGPLFRFLKGMRSVKFP